MSLFDFARDREVNHGDRTVTRRYSIAWLYRRLTIEWTRPTR